jgi:hypothetical protein
MDTFEQTSWKATPEKFTYPRTLAWRIPAWNSFIERVIKKDNTMEYIEDGLANTRLLVALHESLETGKIVDVPKN